MGFFPFWLGNSPKQSMGKLLKKCIVFFFIHLFNNTVIESVIYNIACVDAIASPQKILAFSSNMVVVSVV